MTNFPFAFFGISCALPGRVVERDVSGGCDRGLPTGYFHAHLQCEHSTPNRRVAEKSEEQRILRRGLASKAVQKNV
jgi:hypothetical protein